ncbi:MAG: hypothetical protein FWE94_01935 [Coriobacteriia bacterium]|nr:hypothetical protein [Coriobacteriia bacterium]
MDANNVITLRLESGKVDAADFKRAIESFLDMIQSVADEVAGKPKAVSLLVSVLPGSTCVAAEVEATSPVYTESAKKVASALENGLRRISHEAIVPEYFSESSVRNARTLALMASKIGKKQSVSLRFGENSQLELSDTIAANIAKALEISVSSLGSIEGTLEMLSLHGGFNCNIYDDLTGKRIGCTYSKELLDNVHAAFGKRVSAYGTINYTSDKGVTRLKISSIRIIGCGELPDWGDMRGALGG